MIYLDNENKQMKVVEFGHGSVGINPTNNPDTMIANGVLLHQTECHPIGSTDDSNNGKMIQDMGDSVFLYFLKVDSINVLIEELLVVKRGMAENKSVQDVKVEGCEQG
jgi:hypothetical protein